jgi:outer membrane murein-binding lipoprotein Lpp
MFKTKSTLNYVIVFSAIIGLAFVIGCGSSQEKQAMSDFLQQYNQEVDDYSAAGNGKKAEMQGKLDSYKSKWSDMKMDLGGHVTPQALNELDEEYEKIKKKYASLAHKS